MNQAFIFTMKTVTVLVLQRFTILVIILRIRHFIIFLITTFIFIFSLIFPFQFFSVFDYFAVVASLLQFRFFFSFFSALLISNNSECNTLASFHTNLGTSAWHIPSILPVGCTRSFQKIFLFQ